MEEWAASTALHFPVDSLVAHFIKAHSSSPSPKCIQYPQSLNVDVSSLYFIFHYNYCQKKKKLNFRLATGKKTSLKERDFKVVQVYFRVIRSYKYLIDVTMYCSYTS